MEKYEIEKFHNHYVITDNNENIISHCDTYEEAKDEIEELNSK